MTGVQFLVEEGIVLLLPYSECFYFALYPVGTGVKMKENEADVSHLSSAEVIHAWSFASIPSIYLYDVEHSHKDIFIFVKTFPPDNPLYYTVLFSMFSAFLP